jgi:predicted glycosyltransferase
MVKILFYFGHPAQYLFLRATIRRLQKDENYKLIILIKTKDVLENLLSSDEIPYQNILLKERGKSRFSIITSLLRRLISISKILLREKPNLLIGTDATIAQLGFLFRIPRITITEDDYDVIKTLGNLTYPYTQTILCPKVCDVGKWGDKKVGYDGYMKLGYLHPNVFTPSLDKIKRYNLRAPFVIIRLAKLTAHHDFGMTGITPQLLQELILNIQNKGFDIYISSEATLGSQFIDYQLKIQPEDMHHVLSESSLLICDSQSMSVEAAMLGVPSIRYSSFAGKISVLEELEHTYQLTYGITPGDDKRLIQVLEHLLSNKNLKELFQERRQLMLSEKIDVTDFVEWFIKNYPNSITAKYKVNIT